MTPRYLLLSGAMFEAPAKALDIVRQLIPRVAASGYTLVTGSGLGIQRTIVQIALEQHIPIVVLGLTPEPSYPLPTHGSWLYIYVSRERYAQHVSPLEAQCLSDTSLYIRYQAGCDAGIFLRYPHTQPYAVEQRMMQLGKTTSTVLLPEPRWSC